MENIVLKLQSAPKAFLPTLVAFISMLAITCAATELPKINTVDLDRPLWALGLNDARWLTPIKPKKKSPSFAFFSFSSQKTIMPSQPTEQREDESGRTTRSLPLYLAERINVETNCRANNYIFVVEGSGPVVSGVESDIRRLLELFKSDQPDYLVTGHIVQDYQDLRSKITLRVWDVKGKPELINCTVL